MSLQALGRAIHAVRREKGLTQEVLSKRAGVHPTYMSGIERGTRNLTWIALGKISQALGLKLSELVQRVEQEEGRGDG